MAENTETKFKELVSYSEPALRNNSSIVEYCRTSMSALSGSTAGILGLTGLSGFIFYIFSVFMLWGLLLFKAGKCWQKYFLNRHSLLTGGFFSGLFIFIWNGTCVLIIA
ncbi:ER membrane protein complex subunit 6 isoform X2 [Daktulosphaira vitifoliae]|uniref:ER membrane protein complex subunit 6 isoform X2 n=1 Tax=Daktulosphaira vitifoliae TaxID=58002 RepID=UPI0021AA9B3A|nr:ER membrane protein complex subunit 6 isoform X2 [Daktulosphaira vitifoliae]